MQQNAYWLAKRLLIQPINIILRLITRTFQKSGKLVNDMKNRGGTGRKAQRRVGNRCQEVVPEAAFEVPEDDACELVGRFSQNILRIAGNSS